MELEVDVIPVHLLVRGVGVDNRAGMEVALRKALVRWELPSLIVEVKERMVPG